MKMVAGIMILAGWAWSLPVQTYSIRMDQPVQVGQVFEFFAKGATHRLLSAGVRTLLDEEYSVNFEGLARVVRIDKSGRPYQIEFTVRRFTQKKGDVTVDLLGVGSIIVADGSRDKHYTLRDGILEKPAEEAFGVIYSAHQPDSTVDDDLFGSKQPRSLGESWPINARLASESAQKETQFLLPPEQIRGTTKFVSVDTVGTTPCASLTGQMDTDNVTANNLGPGLSVSQGKLRSTYGGCFPLAESGKSFKASADYSMSFHGAAPNGQPIDGKFESRWEDVWIAAGETP